MNDGVLETAVIFYWNSNCRCSSRDNWLSKQAPLLFLYTVTSSSLTRFFRRASTSELLKNIKVACKDENLPPQIDFFLLLSTINYFAIFGVTDRVSHSLISIALLLHTQSLSRDKVCIVKMYLGDIRNIISMKFSFPNEILISADVATKEAESPWGYPRRFYVASILIEKRFQDAIWTSIFTFYFTSSIDTPRINLYGMWQLNKVFFSRVVQFVRWRNILPFAHDNKTNK